MDADTLDLTKLFVQDVQYEVPIFQRPYVWNEEEHWEPLWEDVVSVIHDHLQRDEHPHFLGAVVLDQVPNPTASVVTRQVIDGQQRLTTLQLLLAAARDVAEERGFDRFYGRLNRLIENDPDVVVEPDTSYKVWPTRSDREGFKAALTGAVGVSSSLIDAYEYFRWAIDGWLGELSEGTEEEMYDALVTVLTRLMMIVVIDLDDKDNAQVIFETLNARGTPLEASDLIKNDLFDRAKQNGEDVEFLHDTYWERFLDDYWREDVRQGRLFRSRIDIFMTHFLSMKMGREVKSTQLFNRFRGFLDAKGDSVESFLTALDHYGGVYAGFEAWPDDSREARFFARLETLELTTAYPFLLAVFGLAGSELSRDERTEVLDALESFLVRRLVCKLTTKNYNRLFLTLLAEVQGGATGLAERVRSSLLAGEGDAVRWPTDDEVMHAVVNERMYRSIRQDRIAMVLSAVNDGLPGFEEPIRIAGSLSIEHLMPQRWREHWGEPPAGITPEEREVLVNSFGNLTLVTQRLNSHLSNGPWEAKRRAIFQHSALPLNRGLPESWDDETIRERSREIGGTICQVWPRPNNSQFH